MSATTDPFFGNRPEDIWDAGYQAALEGRSIHTNPFRTGEAELLDRVGQEAAAYNAARFGTEADVVPHPQGSTPGSSATRVTPAEMREIRRRQQEADEA